jgi:hypothetical protein
MICTAERCQKVAGASSEAKTAGSDARARPNPHPGRGARTP